MLAYALLQVNPEATHAFASDDELDARQETASTTAPGQPCTAETSRPDPGSTASASSPTSTLSRPRESPTPISYQI